MECAERTLEADIVEIGSFTQGFNVAYFRDSSFDEKSQGLLLLVRNTLKLKFGWTTHENPYQNIISHWPRSICANRMDSRWYGGASAIFRQIVQGSQRFGYKVGPCCQGYLLLVGNKCASAWRCSELPHRHGMNYKRNYKSKKLFMKKRSELTYNSFSFHRHGKSRQTLECDVVLCIYGNSENTCEKELLDTSSDC